MGVMLLPVGAWGHLPLRAARRNSGAVMRARPHPCSLMPAHAARVFRGARVAWPA